MKGKNSPKLVCLYITGLLYTIKKKLGIKNLIVFAGGADDLHRPDPGGGKSKVAERGGADEQGRLLRQHGGL